MSGLANRSGPAAGAAPAASRPVCRATKLGPAARRQQPGTAR